MSNFYSDSGVSDALIDSFLDFINADLTEFFILDTNVRRQVAKMMLESGQFVDQSGHLVNVLQMASAELSGDQASKDPFAIRKQKTHVRAGINSSDKSILKTINDDVEIVFQDVPGMPHGLAYAQRVVDLSRLLSLVSHMSGSLIDIGGNYATHQGFDHNFEVHSCTLLHGEVEYHRQTQRNVMMDISNVGFGNYCTAGVENCGFHAPHAISLHTAPNIDPALWPLIFRNHGLDLHIGIFHYHPNIEVDDRGFIPEAEMHWRVLGEDVEFFFEGDASHSYFHKRDWLVKYATEWTATLPDWEFVVHYQVDFIDAGRLQFTMTKLEKATLGLQPRADTFRYVPTDDVTEIMVPEFDDTLGLSVNDPHAYVLQPVRVPTPLFSHVLRYGLSNDTERPDQPLTFEQIKGRVHTYNHVRRVNGTSITSEYKLSSDMTKKVARGMYLIIVHKAALNAVIFGAYTEHMKHLQKRLGDEGFATLVGKSISAIALSPFLMMAQSFNDAVGMVAAQVRTYVSSSFPLAAVNVSYQYRPIQPYRQVHSTATKSAVFNYEQSLPNVELPKDIGAQQFYKLFKDQLSPEHRANLETQLQSETVDENVDIRPEHLNEDVEHMLEVDEDRESWLYAAQRFMNHDKKFTSLEYVEAPAEVVFANWRERIYEYGLYNIDCGLHDLSEAFFSMNKAWTGAKFNIRTIQDINVQNDISARTYHHINGELVDATPDGVHAVILDPITNKRYSTYVVDGKVMVDGAVASHLYADARTKIFNAFALAKPAMTVARDKKSFPSIPLYLENGVPGCGKTYSIIQQFTEKDVICCTVRETADAIRVEVGKKFPQWTDDNLRRRVRTIDSGVINGLPLANTLFVDEGLMVHMGAVFLLAKGARAKAVRVFGDEQQIGFIERGSKLVGMKYESLFFWTQILEVNTSFRMPADVTYLIRQFYSDERQPLIKTCSSVKHSISLQYLPDLKHTVYTRAEKPWTYMTLLQSDKGKLVVADGFVDGKSKSSGSASKVLSVHEMQGGTVPFARLMRINTYTVGLFNSHKHQLVAISRGVLRNEYVTPVKASDDPMAKLLSQALAYTNDQLQEVMLPTPSWLQERIIGYQEQYAAYL